MAVHALASLGYWLAQPRGFEVRSRSFLEHQGVTAILFAVSVAGLAAIPLRRRRVEWIAVGIVSGFWIFSSALIVVLGSTTVSRFFWFILAGAGAALLLSCKIIRPEPRGLLTGGAVAGLVLSFLFWDAAWAPPATTRPKPSNYQPAPLTPGPAEDIRLAVQGFNVEIETRSGKALLWPGFQFNSIADSGIWTIFDYRSSTLPPWKWRTVEDGSLSLSGENEDFRSLVRVWVEKGTVHVRSETRVFRDVASHLSTVMELRLPGPATVEGVPWTLDHLHERTEFLAIRGGRVEFLRAASREKGPFESLGAWPLKDPVLTIDGWKVQVQGWAEHGSPEPSPTAGWGVSQAAIERVGDVYLWSLAATSIGRGWHSVRTAPGVYVLEAVLTPR